MTATFRRLKSRAFGTDLTNQLINRPLKNKGHDATESEVRKPDVRKPEKSTWKPIQQIRQRLANGFQSERDFIFSPKEPQKPAKPSFGRQNGISVPKLTVDIHPAPSHVPPPIQIPKAQDVVTSKPSLGRRHLVPIPAVPHCARLSPRPSPKSPLDDALGPQMYPDAPYLEQSMSNSFMNESDPRHYIRNRESVSPRAEGSYVVSKKDREILIDWIIRISNKFDLNLYTIYLTINVFDRYLASLKGAIQGDRQHSFQLIACATMWIASKYHEVYAPEPDDFGVLTVGKVTKEQLIDMELKVLIAINFELTIETPLSFIPRFQDIGYAYIDMKKAKDGTTKKDAEVQKKVLGSMMMYCLEICSLDYKLSLEKPSKVAAAIMYYCCIGTNIFSWNQFKDDNVLKFVNHYRVNDVLNIMQKIHRIAIKVEKEKKSRIYTKYSSREQYRVTSIAKKMHLNKC